MHICLPDDIKALVDEQVRARIYMTANEYVQKLLRNEKQIAEFRAKIDDGYAAPLSDLDNMFIESVRQRIRRRA